MSRIPRRSRYFVIFGPDFPALVRDYSPKQVKLLIVEPAGASEIGLNTGEIRALEAEQAEEAERADEAKSET